MSGEWGREERSDYVRLGGTAPVQGKQDSKGYMAGSVLILREEQKHNEANIEQLKNTRRLQCGPCTDACDRDVTCPRGHFLCLGVTRCDGTKLNPYVEDSKDLPALNVEYFGDLYDGGFLLSTSSSLVCLWVFWGFRSVLAFLSRRLHTKKRGRKTLRAFVMW